MNPHNQLLLNRLMAGDKLHEKEMQRLMNDPETAPLVQIFETLQECDLSCEPPAAVDKAVLQYASRKKAQRLLPKFRRAGWIWAAAALLVFCFFLGNMIKRLDTGTGTQTVAAGKPAIVKVTQLPKTAQAESPLSPLPLKTELVTPPENQEKYASATQPGKARIGAVSNADIAAGYLPQESSIDSQLVELATQLDVELENIQNVQLVAGF